MTTTEHAASKVTTGDDARAAGEALLRVASRLNDLVTESAAAEGLTALEARLLRSISEAVPQGLLAVRLGCDPARVSVLTGQLEARGLLTRVPSRSDKRIRLARLTPAGQAAIERIGGRLLARSPLVHGLDDAQRAELLRLLTAIDPLRVADPATSTIHEEPR